MESRFTFKDFVFLVALIVVAGAIGLAMYQFNYQEKRLNDVKDQIAKLGETQKQQLGVLTEIRNALKNGVQVAGGGQATTEAAGTQKAGRIHRKNPDGSLYVYYPDIPQSPRRPDLQPDFAYGDWLVQNLGAEPKLITPILTTDLYGETARSVVNETLLAMNPETLEYEPFIADSYTISPDGLKFTYHMRKGVVFSDGKPMTADDVVFSYDLMMNPKVNCEDIRGYYSQVKSCKKLDDYTVEFQMSEPYFRALEITGTLTIVPKHVYSALSPEEFNQKRDMLVGSGPYKLEKWDAGKSITLVRNDKYWSDRPAFDRVLYRFIGNPQAIYQSFQNGDIDEFGPPLPPDPEQYLKLAEDPEFLKQFKAVKFSRPQAGYFYIGWNMDKPMFKDKETRQALTMLIDRKAIIHTMLKDMASEMNGPFTPQRAQDDKSVPVFPYDVEAAKKKLAAAGWKPGTDGVLERDGVRFEFSLSLRSGAPMRERIATYVKQQLEGAGIRMRLTPWEPAILMEKLDNRDFEATLAGWGGGAPEDDPYQIWHSKSIENKGSNHVGFRNAEADKLIEEGRTTMDAQKRQEIWHKFQRIVYDEAPYVFLYSPLECAFINGRFKNTDPYPLGLVEFDWYVPSGAQKYR